MLIYQFVIYGIGCDEYDQLVDIFKVVNSNIVDKRKFIEIFVDVNIIEIGIFEVEYDNEIYFILIMQMFDYEEFIKYEFVQMFYFGNFGK